jgi:hypothetical protein
VSIPSDLTSGTHVMSFRLDQLGTAPVQGTFSNVAFAWAGKVALPDLDASGSVDAADLGLVLANWDQAGETDLDQSGITDAADLGILLSAWGS